MDFRQKIDTTDSNSRQHQNHIENLLKRVFGKISDLLHKKYIINFPTCIFMNIYTVSIWALSQVLTDTI